MTSLPPGTDALFIAFQGALAGRYSIDRELGRGGMGVVYLAREVHLDRLVAIKLLPPERAADPALRERFLREARLAAKLSHPNIIPIHAVDEADVFVFYVMAYVDGETLAHRVRTRGPLTTADGARVMREAAWALAHAHSHGVVRRDVKPDNILIEHGSGRVLVADFGIAAAVRDSQATGVSGTPEFMSPEQALGRELDARSDVYSLGVTGFFAFTGRLPFEGRSATEIIARHVTEPPPPLGGMGTPVSRKVAALVDRCLAKQPDARPPSADAVAEQLGVALEQRRELPAALRAFVRNESRLNGAGTLLFPAALATASVFASAWFGPAAGFGTFAIGMVGTPLAYFVLAARRMLRLGFAHADVQPAFAAELEQSRDEITAVHGVRVPPLERVLRFASRVTGWGFAITFGLSRFPDVDFVGQLLSRLTGPTHFPPTAWPWLGLGAVVTTISYLAVASRRRDMDLEFWARLWRGRIGRAAFAVAKRLVGKGVAANAVTHRATELSLGMAAESLFESLPSTARASLGDVPRVVRRLQDDAQRLRKLNDELQNAVASTSSVSDSPAHVVLRADADRVRGKLGESVAALETIRLSLLRLHAGSGSVEGLTTHVDLAAEVSAEVERMLAARDEVDRSLSFPRETAATPV